MVVFTCSQCGDSVKKPQADKHLSSRRCRGATLCCIDCVKDFYGDEYKNHNSCITENERYGGKNYVPTANKGQQKQQLWFQRVMDAIEKVQHQQPQWLQRHFERLKGYPNIPIKKAKFEAFIKNSFGIRDGKTATQMWEIIDQNIEKPVPPTNQQKGQNTSTNNTDTQQNGSTESEKTSPSEPVEPEKKLSKRERKEERRKQACKKEKKDVNDDCVNGESSEHCEKKKKRKKHQDLEDGEQLSGKKRKFNEIDKASENQEPTNGKSENGENGEPSDEEEPARKKYKTKFDWSGVILEVLQGKNSEIKIKKLRKKVLGEYLSQGCTEKSEEKLWAKFEKKLKKNPQVKILNDRVKLKE